ncbi:MAG: DHH family phosphoesterase [Halobacteriaceae archaeon]
MVTRLVLGCGTFGHLLLDAAATLPGELRVLDPDRDRVETLRNEKIAAERADITDAEEIGGYDPKTVIVAGDDAGINHAAARSARDRYPASTLLVYHGDHPTSEQRSAIAELADHVLSPGAAILDRLDAIVAAGQGRQGQLFRDRLADIDGPLGVFTHDNPDPDAIASAVALVAIAESVGVEAQACYYGEISHQQNRAFVNLLDLEMRRFDPEESIEEFAAIALVDHSRPGVNDQLPEDTSVAIVIDHHPSEAAVVGDVVDVRSDVGATSTILTSYLRQFTIDPDEAVATALLYGIRVDTKDFTRDIVPADFEAAAYLQEFADTEALEMLEAPSVTADTLDTIAEAITRRHQQGRAVATCVGPIADRDTLSQAADRLTTMEGVDTVMVSGFIDGTIYVSARSTRSELDIGEVLRSAFAELGSAGGHTDMAGAQLPLGLFGEVSEDEETELTEIVDSVVTDRFFRAVAGEPDTEESPDGDDDSQATGAGPWPPNWSPAADEDREVPVVDDGGETEHEE